MKQAPTYEVKIPRDATDDQVKEVLREKLTSGQFAVAQVNRTKAKVWVVPTAQDALGIEISLQFGVRIVTTRGFKSK